MVNKVLAAFGGAFAVALLTALGVDAYEHSKVARKIGVATGDLKNMTAKEISPLIIDKAVSAAAKEEVSNLVRTVKTDIMGGAESQLGAAAKKAVSDASAMIQDKVEDKVAEEVGKIDIAELKKSATAKAEAKIIEKFDGSLDDSLAKFNEQLDNIRKIYGGISDVITRGQEQNKGFKFTIG